MLTLLLRGGALEKVRNATEQRNGLEVWRTYLLEYEPDARNRHGGMLAEILEFSFTGSSLLELEQWETKIRQYE